MKYNHTKYLVLIILLTLFLLPVNVVAKEKVTLKANKSFLELGEEITVTANFSSDKKVYALTSTLSYDENVFEAIDYDNFSAKEAEVIYNTKNKKFGLINKTGEIPNNLLKVRLKVKDDANVGETTIKLTNITSSDGEDKTVYKPSTVKVMVTRDAKEDEAIPINKINKKEEVKDKIIKTFTAEPIFIFLGIIFDLLIISLIVTIFLKVKNKKKKVGILLFLIILTLIIIISLYFLLYTKDVNDDGKKDYDDAKDIIKYIIDIRGNEDEEKDIEEQSDNLETSALGQIRKLSYNKRNYKRTKRRPTAFRSDTNGDGYVDITDAAGVVEHVTQEINYNVNLSEVEDKDNYFVEKEAEIILKFNANIDPFEEIKEVVIDGKTYPVIKTDSSYHVKLNAPDKAGKHEFKITKVILKNGRVIDTTLTIEKEILKSKPYVDMFDVDDEKNTFNFNLEDPDNAFIEGTIIIYNEKGEVELKSDVKKENHIKHKFDENVTYTIVVNATYDLDSKKNEKPNLHEDEEIFSHTFQLDKNYDLQVNNVTITDAVQIGEKLKITFDATTAKGYDVEYIVVKGIEYNVVKKEGNHYEFILDKLDTNETGKFHLDIDEIALNNFKVFKKDKDYEINTLTYTVLKKAPKAEDIKLTNNRENKSIDVEFRLVDENFSSTKLTVALIDSTGKIVSQQPLTMEEFVLHQMQNTPIKLSLSYNREVTNIFSDGRYTVKILADYQLADKYSYINESIGEKEILTNTKEDIYISNMFITNNRNEVTNDLYPEKNQRNYQVAIEVTIGENFIANNRAYSRVSGVTINGLNYPASQVSGYKSKIYLNVPSESGVLNITANRVELANDGYYHIYNDYYAVEDKTIQIDVLKDKPKIENLEIKEEDYEKQETTFDFDVVLDDKATEKDEEFKDGTVELNGDKQDIHRGKNSVTFKNIKQDENFDLIFKGSFDLDTDQLNSITQEQNEKTEELYKVRYGLYDNDTYKDIAIEDGKTISEKGNEYFEKNEKIKLNFNISNIEEKLETEPIEVIIDNKHYAITKTENNYELILDGYPTSGKKEISITDIILKSGKKITLPEPYTFKPEVLKDPIKIKDFKYEDLGDDIKVTLELKDLDTSLVGNAKVKITDNNGKVAFTGDYQDEITFKKDKDALKYFVKVTADYDRDINKQADSENHTKDFVLLDEIISLEDNNIEFKNIVDISLYKTETDKEDKTELIDEIEVNEIQNNFKDYFVEVVMEKNPTARARIKNVIVKNDILTFELEYDHATKEGSNEKGTIRIDFGVIKDGKVINEFHPETLFQKIKDNEDVTLTRDYDANLIKGESNNYYFESYTGKINGNGHKIYNLDRPLFNSLKDNASIKNLIIENAKISGPVRGIIANTATNATLESVHIYNSNINANNVATGTGIMFGETRNSIEIKKSSIVNSSVTGGKRTGGFIGWAYNKTTIQDCYINSSIIAGSSDAIGAIIGEVSDANAANNVTIDNCYSKVELTTGSGTKTGILGWTNNSGVTKLNNSISMSDGENGYRIHGNGINAKNVYELEESKLKSNANNNITPISKKDIDSDFFEKKLNWDKNIWDLDKKSYDEPPILKDENFEEEDNSDIEGYDKTKEKLYNNLMKLTPFYDMDKIIKTSKSINDELLIKNEIVHIVPLDQNGNIVTYLTNDNPRKISKIKVVFDNNKTSVYDVKYENTYDMVASYNITSLNIDYSYNHYVINSESQLINNLTNYLDNLDYTNSLDILTTASDSRIYRDFYNDTTKKELREFVLKILSNSNYTNTTNDEGINNYLEREIKKDKTLEKALYTYNYFRRFYDVDIDGMKAYDFIMFNMQGFDSSLTPIKISNLYLKDASGASFNTNQTNAKYRENLSSYTNIETVPKFLEYLVTRFSNQEMSDWTHNQFKGIIYEFGVDAQPEIKYTLWDHFNADKRDEILNQFLPILTLPENAAYIMSMPVQYIIGSQRTYIENPDNPADEQALRAKMDTYKNRYKRYFATAYSILQDVDVFNNIHIYQVDKRFTKTENGGTMFNTPNTTEEPFHKNYVEVTGAWAAAAGNNAAAWNPRVEWQVAGIFDSTLAPEGKNDTSHVTFRTWSHETAHVIDNALFFKTNGRRFDAGGEDYADCFLMQSFGPNDITMNLSMILTEDKDKVASNITPDRISSKEKIQSFYRKLFETVYVMDYLEAKAFLQLSKEEKKALAIQVSYPKENMLFETVDGKSHDYNKEFDQFIGKTYKDDEYARYRARETTRYTRLRDIPEDIELNTVEDLIKNRIMLYPNVNTPTSRGNNSYGGEGINTVHWYQPNNPDGRPDSYALKWISYEMLGYKGYDDGFLEYASNINSRKEKIYSNLNQGSRGGLSEVNYKSDSMALERITGSQFSKFSDYKKYRFDEVAKKLEKLDSRIDAKEYVKKFYHSLKQDAKDATLGSYAYNNSNKIRQEIYYTLKNNSNDFESEIYMKDKQQDVDDLNVPEEEKSEEPTMIENPFATEEDKVPENKEIVEEENEVMDEDNTGQTTQPQNPQDIPQTPQETPTPPVNNDVNKEKEPDDEDKEGLQQDDPTNTTGPEPDPNPDSAQTPAVILPS